MKSGRQTTVLFAGVTGSAELFDAAGDVRAADAIMRCLEAFRQAAAESGGRVVKTMGEEIMALFPTANGAADASARMQAAIESLVEMGGPKLGARVAFHAGPVIQHDGDIFGDSVNIAARLVEQATKGQVLTTAETVALLAPAVRGSTRQLYDITVKGKEEQIALCEYLWQKSPDITDFSALTSVLRAPRAGLRLRYRGKDVIRRRREESITIGRDAGCLLVVADAKASRQHCVIERRGQKFILRDHSTNGTYVAVEGEEEIILRREEFTLRRHGWIAFGQPRAETPDVVEYFCE
ncbi:MAG TPA: adenylate/guanylate cyclase domain-containing protein [Burkholderiales bacterium]|nr:adenylate/guanylate cyclase domain-containing protein [Burkholderiales bacterium]